MKGKFEDFVDLAELDRSNVKCLWDFDDGLDFIGSEENRTFMEIGGDSLITANGIRDRSGFRNDLTSYSGRYLQMDGVTDVVDLGNHADLLEINNFTVSIWFQTANSDTTIDDVIAARWDTNGKRVWRIKVVPTGIQVSLSDNGTSESNTTFSAFGAVITGAWNNVTVTFQSGFGMKLYLNGVLDGQNTGTQSLYSTNTPLSIGAAYATYPTLANPAFLSFGCVYFYNIILSEGDISALYNNPYNVLYPNNLKGKWYFNEVNASDLTTVLAIDSSGNGRHGRYTGCNTLVAAGPAERFSSLYLDMDIRRPIFNRNQYFQATDYPTGPDCRIKCKMMVFEPPQTGNTEAFYAFLNRGLIMIYSISGGQWAIRVTRRTAAETNSTFTIVQKAEPFKIYDIEVILRATTQEAEYYINGVQTIISLSLSSNTGNVTVRAGGGSASPTLRFGGCIWDIQWDPTNDGIWEVDTTNSGYGNLATNWNGFSSVFNYPYRAREAISSPPQHIFENWNKYILFNADSQRVNTTVLDTSDSYRVYVKLIHVRDFSVPSHIYKNNASLKGCWATITSPNGYISVTHAHAGGNTTKTSTLAVQRNVVHEILIVYNHSTEELTITLDGVPEVLTSMPNQGVPTSLWQIGVDNATNNTKGIIFELKLDLKNTGNWTNHWVNTGNQLANWRDRIGSAHAASITNAPPLLLSPAKPESNQDGFGIEMQNSYQQGTFNFFGEAECLSGYKTFPIGPFSFSAWVKPMLNNNGGNFCIVDGREAAMDGPRLEWHSNNSNFNFYMDSTRISGLANSVPTGAYKHVAVTWASGSGSLYQNGVRVAGPTAMTTGGSTGWIGYASPNYSGAGTTTGSMAGQLSYMTFHSGGLTAPQIYSIFAATSGLHL